MFHLLIESVLPEFDQYLAVGTATGYGLDEWEVGIRVLKKSKEFSLLHIVETGSGAHSASYSMSTESSFSGVKRQGREADHSTTTSAEVKKTWIYKSTLPYAFMG
jgi:hypothetical protein